MIKDIIVFVHNLKTRYKSLKPWIHDFNIFILLYSKKLIVMNQLVSLSLFNLLVSFIGRAHRFKDGHDSWLIHNLGVFWVRWNIHKNSTCDASCIFSFGPQLDSSGLLPFLLHQQQNQHHLQWCPTTHHQHKLYGCTSCSSIMKTE